MPVGTEKLKVWLPNGEKKDVTVLTEYQRVADGRTSCDGIVLAMHSIAR